MSVTAVFRLGWPSLRILKGKHDGRPKIWTVVVKYRPVGEENCRTWRVSTQVPMSLIQVGDFIKTRLDYQSAEAGGLAEIEWTAISR